MPKKKPIPIPGQPPAPTIKPSVRDVIVAEGSALVDARRQEPSTPIDVILLKPG